MLLNKLNYHEVFSLVSCDKESLGSFYKNIDLTLLRFWRGNFIFLRFLVPKKAVKTKNIINPLACFMFFFLSFCLFVLSFYWTTLDNTGAWFMSTPWRERKLGQEEKSENVSPCECWSERGWEDCTVWKLHKRSSEERFTVSDSPMTHRPPLYFPLLFIYLLSGSRYVEAQ